MSVPCIISTSPLLCVQEMDGWDAHASQCTTIVYINVQDDLASGRNPESAVRRAKQQQMPTTTTTTTQAGSAMAAVKAFARAARRTTSDDFPRERSRNERKPCGTDLNLPHWISRGSRSPEDAQCRLRCGRESGGRFGVLWEIVVVMIDLSSPL